MLYSAAVISRQMINLLCFENKWKKNLPSASTLLLRSTAKLCARITQNTQYLITQALHWERVAFFCPLEHSMILNYSAAPGMQSNQLEDLESSILIVPAVKRMNSQLVFHVRVVYFASLATKICIFCLIWFLFAAHIHWSEWSLAIASHLYTWTMYK